MSASGSGPRPWWHLLVDRTVGPFFLSKVLSSIGQWIHSVVAAVLAYEMTRSTLVVGLVTASQFVPQLALTPLSGALADRWDRRRLAVSGRALSALGSGGLGLWVTMTGASGLPGPAPIIASTAIVGIGFALSGPATHALLPALVRRSELPAAIALNMAPLPVARAVGPIIGTTVALSAGPAAALALAFALTLTHVAALAVLRSPRRERRAATGERVVAYLRRDPVALVILTSVAALGFGSDPAITLAPAISDRLGHGVELVGPIATAFGVGAGIGFGLLPPTRLLLGAQHVGSAGLALMSVGLGAQVFASSAGLVLAAFVVAGAGMTLALTGVSTTLQLRVPEQLRGRIMALWSMAFLGSRPIASTVGGVLSDRYSVEVASAVVAIVVALTFVVSVLGPRARPEPPT